jgi:hypothetical protein
MMEDEITGYLLKLADRGITGIKVSYDGSGDSGAIDGIRGYTDENITLAELDDKSIWSLQDNSIDLSKDSILEAYLYDYLLEDIEDWYNNEGGYGTVCILVPSGEYNIENNVRVTNSIHYDHSGNLLSKVSKYDGTSF